RYANGSAANRPLRLEVNGAVVNAGLAFAPTGAWATWATASAPATLNAGPNKVRLTATGSNGPNVDYLTVTPGATQSRALATASAGPKPAAGRLSVFPNPASGTVQLVLDSELAGAVQVTVTDALGRIQQRVEFMKTRGRFAHDLPLGRLAAGSYIVALDQGNSRSFARLSVE
ncbi:MAG: T9SS type A sorting domain-containing protein, partial [Hymenobacter sp.]|nr:T9SS type A sorting domain-containing protein [Hymenobacter sp.]